MLSLVREEPKAVFFLALSEWSQEIEENENNKKIYILSKIKNYQESKLRSQQQLITGLPHWEN